MRRVRGGALLALAALSGCANGGTPVRQEGRRLTLTQVDYRFRPQDVAVRATGAPIRIAVVNRGRLAHGLRIVRAGREVVRIPAQLPGGRATTTARLPPGRYRMLCAIGNHEELGMWGTLVVR